MNYMLKNPRGYAAAGALAMSPVRADAGGSEIKALRDEIKGLLTQFQAKNDERLVALERGRDDVLTTEHVDRMNAAISELQAKLDAKVADLQRYSEDLEARINRTGVNGAGANKVAEAAARFFSLARRAPVTPSDADVAAYGDYCRAFDALVRRGGVEAGLAPDLRNALSVGSDPAGGFFVPAEMSTEIERRVFETSPMRQVARVVTIGSDAWEAPYRSNDATSGGWVAEKATRSSTATAQGGMQRIEAQEQYAYPELTQKMLDDAAIDAQSLVIDETEDKMTRTENAAFVTGNGVGKPRGFVDYSAAAVTTDDASRSWGVLQYVPSGAAGGFPTVSGSTASDPDALITLVAKLNPVYRAEARFAMNRSTEAAIRKLKDADGRYLVGFGDLRDNALGFSLLGYPITNMEDMANIASDSFSLAFGNFRRGYLVVDRIGFRLLIDPYTNKPYVGFYITKRVGGDVRNFDAIKLMKFAAS